MTSDVSGLRDVIAVIALLVAMFGAIVAVLTLSRNARVNKAQFVANLTKDFFDDSELRKFYYKIDYELFRFDPTEILGFKRSEDERYLQALLYRYNMVGRLVRLGVLSPRDIEFVSFEFIQVFRNLEIEKYIAWLDAEYEKHGHYGLSRRLRPFDDARWLLEQVGSSTLGLA